MKTRILNSATTALTGALLVGLLSQQAVASEEPVVYRSATAALVDQQALRSDLEQSIRAFKQELKATIDQDLKLQRAPKLELASSVTATRG